FVAVLATNTEQELCTLEEFHRCLNSLQSVTANNDLAFASTRQELLDVCRDLQESVLCVDDHMKLCFTPVQRKVFNQVVAGARQVIEELCVDGPIQQCKDVFFLSFLYKVEHFGGVEKSSWGLFP
ncbi:uncharacterized protein LOC111638878, partial [Centruroides sculpturatus]|uniref:uncharacterized protein LOC111638878 n=1 Tax=Centruroides sculpturatus TaxID=218467 RepID=UPI000C6EB8A9